MDMRVKSISKVENDTKDGKTITYKMVAYAKDGLTEISVKSGFPFEGLSPKTGLIELTLSNSQMTLKEFEGKSL